MPKKSAKLKAEKVLKAEEPPAPSTPPSQNPPVEPQAPPATVEERLARMKVLPIEERLGGIEQFLFVELPLSLKQYDAEVRGREEANHHKLMDDIIKAITEGKEKRLAAPGAAPAPAPASAQEGGWGNLIGEATKLLDNPLIKQVLGTTESEVPTELIGLKKKLDSLNNVRIAKILNSEISAVEKALGLPSEVIHATDAGH